MRVHPLVRLIAGGATLWAATHMPLVNVMTSRRLRKHAAIDHPNPAKNAEANPAPAQSCQVRSHAETVDKTALSH